jgi:hypothetical protein
LNTVLFGLNLHGRPSVATMFAALLATASVCLGLYLDKFDLHLVAVAMSLPWIAVHGFYHPWYTCNRLGIPFFEFLRGCWGSPLTSLLPFFGTVAACKLLLSTRPVIGILVAFLTGLLVLFITYWIWVFPQRWKSRILKWVSMEGTSSPSEPHRPKRSVQQEQTLGINGQ